MQPDVLITRLSKIREAFSIGVETLPVFSLDSDYGQAFMFERYRQLVGDSMKTVDEAIGNHGSDPKNPDVAKALRGLSFTLADVFRRANTGGDPDTAHKVLGLLSSGTPPKKAVETAPGTVLRNDLPAHGNEAQLSVAAESGDTQKLREAFAKDPSLVHASYGGMTLLMCAAARGRTETVRFLLDAGAGPNRACADDGMTALMWAAQGGHARTVGVLMDYGADETLKDNGGRHEKRMRRNAADHAMHYNHQAVLATIREKKAARAGQKVVAFPRKRGL